MSGDVSRIFADREKRYRSVVRQQGRVPTDAEENHASQLQSWEDEARFRETMTPLGAPGDGFRIVLPAGSNDTFAILPGSIYLAGARLENPAAIGYRDQVSANWLTLPKDDRVEPDARLVVWLEAEERVVTAAEDAELLEPALRGPDGAARTRMCWRVRQAATNGGDCAAALEEALGAGTAAMIDPETGAVVAAGTLSIGFDVTDVDTDLCAPALEAGYLGHRNQTYRIKVAREGRFVWGEDNASQLYRVQVEEDRRTIRFLTEPRDEYLRPRAGQTVELLRGDVLLPNLETIAEPDGALFSVAGGYKGGAIAIAGQVDASWLDWLAGLPAEVAGDAGRPRHFYLRVWTGGGENGEPDLPFTPGTARALAGTGLSVTFTAGTRAGDAWTCSARPDAPTHVLPWALARGMVAHGPRRHIVPLALVDMQARGVRDCRPRFRPLERLRDCSTVTVGATGSREGDTDSIAEALARLPAEGGTIALLAGVHVATVALEGRSGVRFEGCAGATRWLPELDAEPLVTLDDCSGVHFSGVRFEAAAAPCIVSSSALAPDPAAQHPALALSDCTLIAPSGCALIAHDLAGALMLRCRIEAGPLPRALVSTPDAGVPAVYLQGSDITLERCDVRAPLGPDDARAQRALGGVQIGGGSRRITLRECLVHEGAGIGVTLGSIEYVQVQREAPDPPRAVVDAVVMKAKQPRGGARVRMKTMAHFAAYEINQGCTGVGFTPPDPVSDRVPDDTTPADGSEQVPVSQGLVEDVVIERSRIEGMGSCGIATYPLGVTLTLGEPAFDAIAVSRVRVVDNAILDCMRLGVPVTRASESPLLPLGGIGLSIATDCLFRGNEITGNGADGGAVCGIGITYGEDIRIEDNRIERNGAYQRARRAYGPNAGVSIGLAVGSQSGGRREERLKSERPALVMHRNLIDQPAGRALRALAIGPVAVSDNELAGANPSRLLTSLSEIVNEVATFASRLRSESRGLGPEFLDFVLDLLGGDAVNLVNLAVAEDFLTVFLLHHLRERHLSPQERLVMAVTINAELQRGLPPLHRRGGETSFSDNRVSLARPRPSGPEMGVSSIFMLSLDDLAFADNQFEIEADRGMTLADAVLGGATVRVSANRGQEAALCARSIVSFAALWNTAALNQTTAGIEAQGGLGTELVGNRSGL